MKRISNKAMVGIIGALSVLGAVALTGSGQCLWALLLVAFLVDRVDDNENN